LTELRNRLIYCTLFFLFFFILSYFFIDKIFAFFTEPLADTFADNENKRLIFTGLTEVFISYLRLSLLVSIILSLPFTIYQVWIFVAPGLLKNPTWDLTALSGFPPPISYSIYEKDSECPLGLDCYKDLDEGIAAAKAANKPIMLDFTGWACVNCRKMEEHVWPVKSVFNLIDNDYVFSHVMTNFQCMGYGIYTQNNGELWVDNVIVYGRQVASDYGLGRDSRISRPKSPPVTPPIKN